MKLQDHHNEFAVKCLADYMQRSDVANAFMQEFEHDLPKPPPPPEPPNYDEEVTGAEYQFSKNEYVKNKMDEIKISVISVIFHALNSSRHAPSAVSYKD